jgi:energy-coupling factor transport system ATP-binding protein
MGLSEEEIAVRVREAAAFTGVGEELLDKSPFDLSGGQKRRVAIAGIMAMRPEVLVLDEPAAGLDPQGRDYILNGIYEYQRKTDCTVLIVSHSMEDMARLCDEVVVLYRAKVVKQGSGREVFSHADELSEIGLDIPQITRLLQMLKEKGMPISDDIYTVDEAVAALKKIL